jgi:riboflavin synthase
LEESSRRCMGWPMFTGIVADRARVLSATVEEERLDIWIDLAAHAGGLQLGASVAVDGVCLTVVEIDGTRARFQVITETLRRTTLGNLAPGSLVNVERSYRIGDELGGHEVAGHVIGIGLIGAVDVGRGETAMRIDVKGDWMKYILPKGFVAIDGASLTVGETSSGCLWLHLIPETLRRTGLGVKAVGDLVNVELDARTVAIVDTVERVLEQRLGRMKELHS